MKHTETDILRIGMKSLFLAGGILLILITLTGITARAVPAGTYERVDTPQGMSIVEGSFSYTDAPSLPVWRWYTATVEVLFGDDGLMIITIMIFMCLIAGAVSVMNSGGILHSLLEGIISSFSTRRYHMEALIILVLMLFGSVLGSMEEVVVLVPLLTALAVRMGWDRLTGLGLSLGAIAMGFAAALTNPFTIGVAQRLAGLPLFSGFLYRLFIFITVYSIYTWYVVRTSSHREVPDTAAVLIDEPVLLDERRKRALWWFTASMAVMALLIILLSRSSWADLILPAVLLCFLAGGIGSGALSGMSCREIGRSFFRGAVGIAPGTILILMASSIKHIMVSSHAMDTILFRASLMISGQGPYAAVIMVYALVLLLNVFISSGSAKAFLIIPIITPLADMVGLSRQSAVLAFQFGDGFSNILYPTNALLLICLTISGVSYLKWLAWIWKIQALLFIISILFLLGAVRFGY